MFRRALEDEYAKSNGYDDSARPILNSETDAAGSSPSPPRRKDQVAEWHRGGSLLQLGFPNCNYARLEWGAHSRQDINWTGSEADGENQYCASVYLPSHALVILPEEGVSKADP